MYDIHSARRKVKELVNVYTGLIKPDIIEKKQKYGETNTRNNLIDPLLEALNWVDPGDKSVVDNEFYIKGKEGFGQADYALKVNGTVKILIEAKDIIKEDIENGEDVIYGVSKKYVDQLLTYAYELNKKGENIEYAILTNGREFILYYLHYRGFKLSEKKVFKLKIEEYFNKFDCLWTLERENFIKGDRLKELIAKLEDFREKIDKKAVVELLKCKDILTSSMFEQFNKDDAMRSAITKILNGEAELPYGFPKYHEMEGEGKLAKFVNEATSNLINKVLFIRILEDKGFLTPKLTTRGINKWMDFWGHRDYRELIQYFQEVCRDTEKKYNGGLFELNPYDTLPYSPEKIKEVIDVLGEINFGEISSDIIGRIYEIYLGCVLKIEGDIKSGRKVRYEPDARGRKKLGQYFTPQFVVKYIVENTLGELIKDKSPEEVSKIKVLDPACGSGSFLIHAFDYLSQYYGDWNDELIKKMQERVKRKNGVLEAFEHEPIKDVKNKILKENIYGVDLNQLSVQIAEINLWLRSLDKGKKLIKLNKNLKHGNSLISGVFKSEDLEVYKGDIEKIKDLRLKIRDTYGHDMTPEEEKKVRDWEEELTKLRLKVNPLINEKLKGYFGDEISSHSPFNWGVEYPEVLDEGGFDVVIGNPPYVTLALGKKQHFIDKPTLDYLKKIYPTSSEYKGNTFSIFIEKSIDAIRNKGLFGFIIPNTLLTNHYFKGTRKLILDTCKIRRIINFKKSVFEEAETGGNIILLLQKESNKEERNKNLVKVVEFSEEPKKELSYYRLNEIKQSVFYNNSDYRFYLDLTVVQLIEKIKRDTKRLGEIAIFYNGIKTGNNKKFLSKSGSDPLNS